MGQTHEVVNQPPALENYNVFEQDRVLVEGIEREAAWARPKLVALGQIAGGEAIAWGVDANRNPPVLHTHDRFGHRIDEIAFHPAWHHLMRTGIAHELHALPWRAPRPGAHVARAGLFMLMAQAEAGFGCPLSMTYSSIPALRAQPEIANEWEPRLTSTDYDPRNLPAHQKRGAICGMAMTEKQGGSDVRANTTRAQPIGSGGEYLLTGHKWFCSAPMSDLFLVLAQSDRGLSCFALPRFLPDGTRNAIEIERLKDKLGNRSNASGEVEYSKAWARLVGEEGRGVATILEMVAHTRLDCAIGAAAGMRQAVAEATHHAAHRSAFGKRLIDQPLMQNVLADLCLESESATLSMLRLARAYDAADPSSPTRRWARLATAVIKYWVCKRTPPLVAEALECLGGNGYVEESPLPRLYREAPVNSVWEGSGNVICLDVLRALAKDPDSLGLFFDELALAKGEARFDRFVTALKAELADRSQLELRARRLVERLALALQASLMLRHAPGASADAFCKSRLDSDRGLAFGTLPASVDFAAIIERTRPKIA